MVRGLRLSSRSSSGCRESRLNHLASPRRFAEVDYEILVFYVAGNGSDIFDAWDKTRPS